jgi:ATP-dependent DNA helicase RecG
MAYHWTTPIRYVRGLGPTRSRELIKIGIHTVGDLLERCPLSYIYPSATPIADASEGMVVVKAKVKEIKQGHGSVVEAVLDDGTGTCRAVWYHGAWLLANLRPGMVVTFWGKAKR